MTKQEMTEHLRERGVPHVRDGETLRCLDLTQIAGVHRANFDPQGFWIAEAESDSATTPLDEGETASPSDESTEQVEVETDEAEEPTSEAGTEEEATDAGNA